MMRYLAYQAGIIGNRANSFQSGMSGLPSPPLAEPCDEEIEPTPYRDGEAEWTASGDAAEWDDAATDGDVHWHVPGGNIANGDDVTGQRWANRSRMASLATGKHG